MEFKPIQLFLIALIIVQAFLLPISWDTQLYVSQNYEEYLNRIQPHVVARGYYENYAIIPKTISATITRLAGVQGFHAFFMFIIVLIGFLIYHYSNFQNFFLYFAFNSFSLMARTGVFAQALLIIELLVLIYSANKYLRATALILMPFTHSTGIYLIIIWLIAELVKNDMPLIPQNVYNIFNAITFNLNYLFSAYAPYTYGIKAKNTLSVMALMTLPLIFFYHIRTGYLFSVLLLPNINRQLNPYLITGSAVIPLILTFIY